MRKTRGRVAVAVFPCQSLIYIPQKSRGGIGQKCGEDRKTKLTEEQPGLVLTSGKSTQKAFIFKPYRKPAKLSLNRCRLSFIS